ncbi:MAG: hypothetical protein JWP29_3282 [Rhodoferax sp.]|nr:hypothetical protein [Rhodoferax sp.]
MYAELLQGLTKDDRIELAAHGVPSSRVSEWKTGFKFPSRPQALVLATVKGVDFDKLERELTALEIAKDAEKNAGFLTVINKLKGAWQFT